MRVLGGGAVYRIKRVGPRIILWGSTETGMERKNNFHISRDKSEVTS